MPASVYSRRRKTIPEEPTLLHWNAITTLLSDVLPHAIAAREPVAVPAASDQAMQYYRSDNILWFVDTLWGLLVPAVLLFTGLSAKIRSWAARRSGGWFLTIALYLVVFMLLSFVVDLPLGFYQDYL